MSPRSRGWSSAREDRAADSSAAPGFEHRHAADVAVGKQPSRRERLAVFERDRVLAALIQLVELELLRHALLLDEDCEADGRGMRARPFPGHQIDLDHDTKSIIAR